MANWKSVRKIVVVILILVTVFPYDALKLIEFSPFSPPLVDAASSTISTPAQLSSGYFSGTEASSKSGELRLQAAGSLTARVWKTPQLTLGDQTSVVSDGTFLYLKISGDNIFTRYDPATNTWKQLAPAPLYSFQGSDMKRV